MKDKTKDFFSVIIPVYNKEPHISRSINSVLNQTFKNFELIIVCDPSTDNSNIEVKKFTDKRIKIFYRDEPGAGGYAARNLGIKKAKTEWICFLDADDEWYPTHLEAFRNIIEKFKNAKVLGCKYNIYQPKIKNKLYLDAYGTFPLHPYAHYIKFEQYLKLEITSRRPIWTSIACVKKDVLLNVGCFPEGKTTRGGDVDTWLRCVEFAEGLAWSPHKGAIYYMDSVNMVTKHTWTDGSLEKSTIIKLLPKYSGNIAKLLKANANRRIRTAWVLNLNSDKKNFNLISYMFLDAINFKDLGVILLTFLPNRLVKLLIKFYLMLKVI